MHSVLDAMLDIRCLAWMLAGAIVLVGCDARRPANAPIATQDLTKGYRLQRVKADPDNPGDVLVILTLSGGSIVAAYYAVHRERLFRDFESRFLKRDVERQIRAEVFANLPRLARPG